MYKNGTQPRPDIDGETTPCYLICKNLGITLNDLFDHLERLHVEILMDRNRKPAVRKSDLQTLLIGR